MSMSPLVTPDARAGAARSRPPSANPAPVAPAERISDPRATVRSIVSAMRPSHRSSYRGRVALVLNQFGVFPESVHGTQSKPFEGPNHRGRVVSGGLAIGIIEEWT